MLNVAEHVRQRALKLRHGHDKTLFISADGSLPYGRVVSVIDAAKGAGVARVGVITETMRGR